MLNLHRNYAHVEEGRFRSNIWSTDLNVTFRPPALGVEGSGDENDEHYYQDGQSNSHELMRIPTISRRLGDSEGLDDPLLVANHSFTTPIDIP